MICQQQLVGGFHMFFYTTQSKEIVKKTVKRIIQGCQIFHLPAIEATRPQGGASPSLCVSLRQPPVSFSSLSQS